MAEGFLRIGTVLIFLAAWSIGINLFGSHLLGGGQTFLWIGLALTFLGVALLVVGVCKMPAKK